MRKIVYLMRGLPSCGKSHLAKRLAGETGVICETDEYFYTQVGTDPERFDYKKELMVTARAWNLARFKKAVDAGVSPVIVDRGNALSEETQVFVRYALDHGYELKLTEPDSEWWQEIRVLLKYKQYTGPVLDEWAKKLARMSRETHRVPAKVIRHRMEKWRSDLTIEQILAYRPRQGGGERRGDGTEAAENAKPPTGDAPTVSVNEPPAPVGSPSSAPTVEWSMEFKGFDRPVRGGRRG